MKFTSNITSPSKIINFFISFLPISFVIGNAAININVVLIQILFLLFFSKLYFIYFKIKKNLIITLLLLFLFSLNILYSINTSASLISFLGILRYGLLLLNFHLLLKYEIINFKNFEKILILTFIFVLYDTIHQYINGYDLFSYPTYGTQPVRLTGPFGNEPVPGSFLVKLSFLFIYSVSSIFQNTKYKNIFFFLLIILLLIFITVLLTKERAATIMILLGIFTFVLLNQSITLKLKLLIFLSFFFISIILITNVKSLNDHYINRTIDQLGLSSGDSSGDSSDYSNSFKDHNKILDSQWGAHYLTAFEIFKDYPLLGSGMKTFSIICSDKKYDNINSASKDSRCSTHPHNTYYEILYSGGLLFFIIFFGTLIFLFYKILYINSHKKIFLFTNWLILFFPFQTTGSLYQTWNGLFFVFFGIYLISVCTEIKKN